MPDPSLCWQQRLQATPDHLYRMGLPHGYLSRCCWLRLLLVCTIPSSIVMIARPPLMPAPPPRPA